MKLRGEHGVDCTNEENVFLFPVLHVKRDVFGTYGARIVEERLDFLIQKVSQSEAFDVLSQEK